MSVEDDPAALKTLQDAIYRGKVERARAMTPEQRLAEALELSNDIYHWMHSGAMSQLGLTDADEGWAEVSRRLGLLRRIHERDLYKPVGAVTSSLHSET